MGKPSVDRALHIMVTSKRSIAADVAVRGLSEEPECRYWLRVGDRDAVRDSCYRQGLDVPTDRQVLLAVCPPKSPLPDLGDATFEWSWCS